MFRPHPPPLFSYISYLESVTVSLVFAVNTCKMCFLPPYLMIKRLLSKNWRDYVSNGKKILAVWYRNKCLSWCLFISRRRGGTERPNIGSMRENIGGKGKEKDDMIELWWWAVVRYLMRIHAFGIIWDLKLYKFLRVFFSKLTN